MSISTTKSSIFILGCTFISLVHGNDLIAFGKSCLVKEELLKKAETRLEELSLRSERTHRKNSQAINYLERYQTELADLETEMTECINTTPNSAYCHQVRRRYNELTYLIQRVKTEAIDNNFGDNDASINYEITRANFNQHYDDFLALCRDSNTHYSLVRNPTAYAEVCSNPTAKESITCTLF
ncbi:hypothetical protein EBI01_01775 [Marinomonas rhizomae]|uniref:Uncharacterized protein n=1 Tax=Marinomonas rhizomae TaxID=491948 RepID=A0A366JFN6_9GAMM|nr:hypothetical protein [Marinomonas rhizomae]RBP85796.1 hypothetical protein DFP80_101291 [Marinomonas rhizomae]RNF75587.1 hypothetical protein EBI01_01775 [Marinomonas rhizomae]